MRKNIGLGIMIVGIMLLAGCSHIPENTVFSLDDLEGKKIGVQLEATADIYAADIKDAEVKRFNKSADAVKALKLGEIDAVILDDGPAKVFVEENDSLRILEEPFADEEYALAVKKGNSELLDKINNALDKLETDGTIEAIFKGFLYDGEKTGVYRAKENPSYANGTLVVVSNAEFPPYESMQGEEIVGIDVDIMKAVCDELDMKLEMQNIAFESVLAALDKGNADVAATALSVTDERKEIVDFSKPYATAKQVVIVRKD
ncbi:MAG: transporter substrate-binding domain-containing protein [Bacteroidales bacterium]|nr:transporter substrate-binding domain-containing protein [Clostridium sp.]MCM1203190.1 transporter substrate-binding domain-containing protein [Bacteroidales bacterium]